MVIERYGTWPSVIDAAQVAAGVGTLAEPRAFGRWVYWLESRPTEGGRTALVRAPVDGASGDAGRADVVPAPYDVRSRVYEYGGGAYLPTPFGAVFVNGTDQNLYMQRGDGIRPLTEGGPDVRYADFCVDVNRQRLIVVSERHGGSTGTDQPRHALEVLDLAPGETPGTPRVLHQGRDFYAAPRLSPDGSRLAFLAWDHPNMPWDGTELRILELDAAGGPGAETLIAGGAAESVLQPTWMPTGTLIFASDTGGFWNLHRFDAGGTACILEDVAEYASPPWQLAQASFAAVGERHLVATRRDAQETELLLVDVNQGFATPLPCHWQEVHGLTSADGNVLFIGGSDDEPSALVRLPLEQSEPVILARSNAPAFIPDWISRPEPLRFATRDGGTAFAYYYAPVNPEVTAPPAERPPLVVMTHGGPTSQTSRALNPRIQYFTSRGFAVVDVDYRGSAGYGRAYRKALDGCWGILDVHDCEDAVAHLAGRGLIDPLRVVIRGGSAGGFTTLSALTRSRVFAAGASHYGVADLTALAAETHKFESRYLDSLVGDAGALRQRSPIHHIDGLRCPVIFFQGRDDHVVPPGQARAMVEALMQKRLPVAFVEFDGEGHGFRRAESVQRALSCEYAFYCRVFGLESADPMPELEIANL